MKVFILEDNRYKLQDIIDCLNQLDENIEIDSCAYFNEGVGKLINGDYDYAILDNNLLRFSDSADIVTNAAEFALNYLERRENNVKCVVCSSDDVQINETYPNYIGKVKYSSISLDWVNKLKELINSK